MRCSPRSRDSATTGGRIARQSGLLEMRLGVDLKPTGIIVTAGLIVAALATSARAVETLVWSDEFTGTSVDPAKWEFMIGDGTAYGNPGWGNNELQYYTARPENAVVSGGLLRIIARQENFGGKNYTSARMRSRNRAEFLYGRMEARIKLPSTPGIWPAFWMLPTDSPYGGWAASGEIDIMESVNFANTIYGSIHFGGAWPNNTHLTGTRSAGIDYSQDFHVYGIEWGPQSIRWYVNGITYYIVNSAFWYTSAAPGDDNAPFDHPFHFLLNVAVGGNFPGNPTGSSTFPQEMVVDWVRVYQDLPAQTPFNDTPRAIPGRIESEEFDNGGQNNAYFDCDPINNGAAFRSAEGVDIETCSEGGFDVGWICANEWLEYTVNVQAAGTYSVEARVASLNTGGSFHLLFDGVDLTGAMTVPVTGGWQNWTTITAQATLPAGTQVLRFSNANNSNEYNINWIQFTLQCQKGDMNASGTIDADDLGRFADTLISPQNASAIEQCAADIDSDGSASLSDVEAFVTLLLTQP